MIRNRSKPVLAAAVLASAALLAAPMAGAETATGAASDTDQGVGVPGPSVNSDTEHLSVAPGMDLDTFASLEPDGWSSGSVLTVDVDADVTFDYQYSGTVTEAETIRAGAERTGATAAINADFFDINNSYAPLGPGISRDEGVVSSPVPGRNEAVAVTRNGAVQLAQIFLEGEVVVDGGPTLQLDGVNAHSLPTDGIGVFTSLWGEYTRAGSVGGAAQTAEVTVVDGVVTEAGTEIGGGAVGDDTFVLVGRGAGAEALLTLEPGTSVDISYAPRSDVENIATAVGGSHVLVEDGVPRSFSDGAVHPRTAIGVSEDGSEVFLAVIDGRQSHARGMSLTELGEFMHELGAHDALNLDGGGSSTMVIRDPGTVEHDVVNSPSDGSERSVANGLAVFAGGGTGTLSGFRLLPEADSDRVFPGMTRTITALGLDEARNAVASAPSWSVEGGTAEVSGDGTSATVAGLHPGTPTVVASEGDVREELELTVLDELEWIEPSTTLVPLADADGTDRIELTGYDAAGYQAPIEPADIEVSGGEGVVELVPEGAGFTVDALVDSGSALLTFTAGDVQAQVAVTIGLVEQTVADFSDADQWSVGFARASGAIEPTEGPDGRSGLRMSYDFTGPNTRAAYAIPPERFELPGQPQTVNAWVKGDGNRSWIRMRLYDRSGTLTTLNGGYTTFTGWRKLSFEVPEGTEFPLTFRDIYSVEPRGDARYDGETSFSDITVEVAPDVEMPVPDPFADPVIITDGTTDDAEQRIAVMSDSQFVGRNPDSDIVAAARRTLREIVAAEPDALIINGDFVDEAAPEDFELARKVLDEELAGVDFPWYYVPGNHEVQGGPISNFIDEFGDTQRVFDVGSTRVVTLNTAFGTLRAGGSEFEQLMVLREQLDQAAEDPSVNGVIVAGHHPPDDPLPADNSQLVDRREAEMLQKWLAEFEAGSGKPAAYVGAHAGVFHASSLDGVPYLVNGNSGKSPSSTPDNGGFTGWTMLGIKPDHADGADVPGHAADQARENAQGRPFAGGDDERWLSMETVVRVDELSLDAPDRLPLDSPAPITATVEQDDGARTVPVAWPVSADWSGRRVHVGSPDDAEPRDVVAIDPLVGTVTALRPGIARVTVTVNGVSVTERIVAGR